MYFKTDLCTSCTHNWIYRTVMLRTRMYGSNMYVTERDINARAVWRSGLHVWLVMQRSWLTRNTEVVGSRPIRDCFLEQDFFPLLLSTGWFQAHIRSWYHNRTKINWGSNGRHKCRISFLVKYRNNQIKTKYVTL